jgi:hypothetical protein
MSHEDRHREGAVKRRLEHLAHNRVITDTLPAG